MADFRIIEFWRTVCIVHVKNRPTLDQCRLRVSICYVDGLDMYIEVQLDAAVYLLQASPFHSALYYCPQVFPLKIALTSCNGSKGSAYQ